METLLAQDNLNKQCLKGFLNRVSPRNYFFVEKLPDALTDEARQIFIQEKCVFDEAKFCTQLEN